jgi:hypothetical protein
MNLVIKRTYSYLSVKFVSGEEVVLAVIEIDTHTHTHIL